MDHERLRESLEHLRSVINHTDVSDPQSKAKLNALISDIERKLENPQDTEHHESLVRSVKESIGHFEVMHPRATDILNQVMTSLGGFRQ